MDRTAGPGWAIRLGKLALWVGGLSGHVHDFCTAPTLEAQAKIWEDKFRPVLLSSWVVNLFLSNPAFLWFVARASHSAGTRTDDFGCR